MKSCFTLLILICLLAIPLYPRVSVAQDVQSQAVSVGQGVERLWSDLPKTVNILQGESEAPMGYEVDLTLLQALKNQPFKLADNLPSTKVDGATSLSELQPLAPTILRNFEGLDDLNQPDGFLHRPPDPILAVGFNHVGVMVNSEFAFYTKDGTLVIETSFSDWWSNVYSGASLPFDPRISYDHHADRWLMVALVKDDPDSWYLLSVSQTSDPTGAWWNYRLDGTLTYRGENTWADYPDLGFDGITDGAIYVTSNQFTFADNRFRTAMLNILPKSALYSGSELTYWRAWGRTNQDGSQAFTLRAAHTFGNPGGEFLINSKSGGWNKVSLWRVNPTFPPDPVDWVRQATITIGRYSPPPDAQQMGGSATLDTIDNRIYNCIYRNGYLYGAFTEAYDWGSGTVAAIRYFKIDTSTNNVDLNVRYGADGYYYWLPAIYTDSSDNMMIVFARSSATEYAGIRYTGHRSTDPLPQPSALLKAGETYITGYRWGDYFGIGNDPSDGMKVWIYGEWAKDCPRVSSDWDWGTWVGEVSFTWAGAQISVVNPITTDNNFIFYTNTTTPGTRFNATVWLYNVTDLFAYQVNLTVNDTLLNITRAWLPTWDPQWVFYNSSTVQLAPVLYDVDADGSNEAVRIGDSLLSVDTPFNGSGLLAIIEFEIIYAPTTGIVSSTIEIDNVDTYILDSELAEIPSTKINGYYESNYVPMPPTASFTYSPTAPLVNETVTFDASVSTPNGGSIVNYIWSFGDGNITSVAAQSITHIYTSSGVFNVTLAVTDDEGLSDTIWQIITIGIRDIAVVSVMPSKTIVGQDYSVSINVTVENQGDYAETINVTAYANTTTISTFTNTSTTSGNFTTLTFTWNTTNFVKGNYTVSAYATPLPGETDLADNDFTDGWVVVAIIGDVTGPDGWPDGEVDIRDIAAMARLFGVNYPDPHYNANYDIIYDGKIDIKDIATAAIHYGETDA